MKNYVTVHADVVDAALAWAKENCPNYITNDYHRDSPVEFDLEFYDFFFTPSAIDEMTMFALRWS